MHELVVTLKDGNTVVYRNDDWTFHDYKMVDGGALQIKKINGMWDITNPIISDVVLYAAGEWKSADIRDSLRD